MSILTLALTPLLLPPPCAPQEPPREGRVAVHDPALPQLTPALRRALATVHRTERALLDLQLFDGAGLVSRRALSPDAGEDDPLLRFLLQGGAVAPDERFPGYAGFAFDGAHPSLEHLLECARYEAGHRAALELVAADPEPDPAPLLAALGDAVAGAPPVEGSREAGAFHEVARRQQRHGLLGNGSMAYVAWGLLMLEEPWAGERAALREAFVADVLAMGLTSDLASWTAQRVLQLPLAWDAEHPARGIALQGAGTRGRFGFTDAHQDFLEGLRASIVAGVALGSASGDGAGTGQGRLEEWTAIMLERVLRDRGTALDLDRRLRRGTLAERLRYWADAADRLAFDDFRAAMLAELACLAGGAGELPGAERIAELEGAAGSRALTAEEEAELAELRRRVRATEEQLAEHLMGLLVTCGGPAHVAAVADCYVGEGLELLGGIGDERSRKRIMMSAWQRLALVDSDQGTWVVEDHLRGQRTLPEDAAVAMISLLTLHGRPGHEALLERIATEGGWAERGAALANPYWMEAAQFEGHVRAAVTHCTDGTLEGRALRIMRMNALHAMAHWEGDEGRALLLETFENGHWREDRGDASWSRIPKGDWLTATFDLLSPAERADLVARGLAPAELFAPERGQ